MIRISTLALLLLALACISQPNVSVSAVGYSSPPAADNPSDHVASLKDKAEHANPKKRSKIYIEIVAALVDRASKEYKNNQYDAFTADIHAAGDALTNAIDNAKQYHHDEKRDDLLLDPVERRLRELVNTVAVQDRPPVAALLAQVRSARDMLIQLVFDK